MRKGRNRPAIIARSEKRPKDRVAGTALWRRINKSLSHRAEIDTERFVPSRNPVYSYLHARRCADKCLFQRWLDIFASNAQESALEMGFEQPARCVGKFSCPE